LTEEDLDSIAAEDLTPWCQLEIEAGSGPEVLELRFWSDWNHDAIHFDANDGERLGLKSTLYRARHVWAAPVVDLGRVAPATCTGSATVTLASAQFHARAIHREIPEYPRMAATINMTGHVAVSVVVADDGSVLCANVSAFPFGV